MHLGLHDIDRARAAVGELAHAAQVVDRDQAGHDPVENAFRRLRSVGQQNGRIGHQVADIAHEQQGPAVQAQGRSVRRGIGAVGFQFAHQGLAALVETGLQIAAHQAQPVGVGLDLVVGVHRRDGVLQIDNGRQGRFQHHIGQAGRVGLADGMGAVDDQFDVDAVMAQQDRAGRSGLTAIAGELRGFGQGGNQGAADHREAGGIGIGA